MPALPSDADGWRARARAVAEEVLLPTAVEADRSDRLPPSVRARMQEERFFGLGIPREWGGVGGDTRCISAVLEELAAGSAAAATMVSVHLSVAAAPILEWGSDAQRERYLRPLAEGRWLGAFALTEPGVGSDTSRLATRYSVADGGFSLTGSKMFITNAAIADLLLLFATRDPSLGAKGVTAFLLPKGTPGVSVTQHLDKLGLRASETNELVLEAARLPREAQLGPDGAGLRVALGALTGGRVGIASCALGVARGAFEEMRRRAQASGSDLARIAVARAYVDLSAARALVEDAARRKDAGQPYVEAASAAKLYASQAAVRIASAGVEVAGWEGTRSGEAPERLLRDARVFPIVEGTTEIQELILGRSLVGRAPPT